MIGKKVLVVGVGVQGSTVAKCIDQNPLVSEIICADQDERAVSELVAALDKGNGVVASAADKANIAEIAQGVDVIVNAMPLPVMIPTLEAALEAKVNYLDFNAPFGQLDPGNVMNGYQLFLDKYHQPFKEIGKALMGGAGAAPGLINVVTRHAMRYLDSCEKIMLIFNEGLRTKRFIPFWWSPATAMEGMQMPGRAFINGELIFTKPYSGAIHRNWPETGRNTVFYEHGHPEPATMGYHAKEHYKGVQEVYFKYGGVGVEFAKPLFDLGLLSQEPEELNGSQVTPYDLIIKHLPKAPKYIEEIKEIIEEGIIEENSAVVVEATGIKDGKRIMVEAHVFSPGLEEAFEKIGFTSEMYQTGMSGALFTKMLLEDKIPQKGVVTADMFTEDQVDCFFQFASKEGHSVKVSIADPINEETIVVPYED